MYFSVVWIVCFVTFPVLFVCICVLNDCHRVATQLQLNLYHIIPTESRWPARDTGAQKRSTLCNNIIPRNNVSCLHLLRFQCNWSLRSGCQGQKMKVYVIRTKHNPPCILWVRKLWVVEFQSSFRQMWRLLLTSFVYIVLPHAPYKQQKDCTWYGRKKSNV